MKLPDAYKLLYPRIVCLITTVDARGRINAAPADWATPIEFDPPLVGIVIDPAHRTWKNIAATKEFVINIPTAKLAKEILICAKKWPAETNKLEKAGLTWHKAEKVRPPLVNECPANLECKLREIVKKYCLIIGEVVAAHAPAKKFKPLLHIGGYKFSTLAEKKV